MPNRALSDLHGLPVMLSASLPDELCGTARALDLQQLLVAFLRGLLAGGGRLIFGGHPSVTPLVHRVALQVGLPAPSIELYQLARYRDSAPPESREPTFSLHWIESEELADLRQVMIKQAAAALFVGGRTKGFSGTKPGIRDEFERFLHARPQGPAYLLGLLDGEARRLIEELEASGQREPNNLTAAELYHLHHTTDVDVAVSLVLADLRRQMAEERSSADTKDRKRRAG